MGATTLPARRFLYIVAGLIVFTLAAAIGWNIFQDQLMRAAFVPSTSFTPPPEAGAPDYTKPGAWLARPDLPDDPARFVAPGFKRAERPAVAVFYVPPTSYMKRDRWNASLDDSDANDRLRLFTSSQASAFNGMGAVWAPRYRQATLGAFMATNANSTAAIDFAYADVARAFDAFLAQIPQSRPILLAGHSQGSLHLMRLMAEKVAGKPIAKRIVAAYVIGWPVSETADLPAMGLPACTGPGEAGCVLSWQSFAEPADTHLVTGIYNATTGLAGIPRRDTPMLCINPITGAPDTAALRTANRGSLVPDARMESAELKAALVPARCDASGFLMIGAAPDGYAGYVLPGGNFHVFDYALFWANIRADAEARAATFLRP